jgi:hypothetical protein
MPNMHYNELHLRRPQSNESLNSYDPQERRLPGMYP